MSVVPANLLQLGRMKFAQRVSIDDWLAKQEICIFFWDPLEIVEHVSILVNPVGSWNFVDYGHFEVDLDIKTKGQSAKWNSQPDLVYSAKSKDYGKRSAWIVSLLLTPDEAIKFRLFLAGWKSPSGYHLLHNNCAILAYDALDFALVDWKDKSVTPQEKARRAKALEQSGDYNVKFHAAGYPTESPPSAFDLAVVSPGNLAAMLRTAKRIKHLCRMSGFEKAPILGPTMPLAYNGVANEFLRFNPLIFALKPSATAGKP